MNQKRKYVLSVKHRINQNCRSVIICIASNYLPTESTVPFFLSRLPSLYLPRPPQYLSLSFSFSLRTCTHLPTFLPFCQYLAYVPACLPKNFRAPPHPPSAHLKTNFCLASFLTCFIPSFQSCLWHVVH